MRAVYIRELGPNGVPETHEVPDPPPPADTQVLVRVRAAGINRADLLQAKGLYPPPEGYSPNIPGLEFAGEVAAIGNNVTRWTVGDRVFGVTAGEAQAEYLLTDEALLAAIPENLEFTPAAAVPEAFITAADAIFTQAGLHHGETLLVHAVGSGVGLAGLQLGKTAGATVVGTSRTAEKLDKCKAFGLDAAIQTDGNEFAEQVAEANGGRGVDVILDLVGGAYFQQNLACLAPKGRLMLVGLTSGRKAEFDLGLALQQRLTIRGTVLRSRSFEEKADATARFAEEVVPLLAAGKIVPNVDSVFPVSAVAEAYKHVGSNASFGKVILEF